MLLRENIFLLIIFILVEQTFQHIARTDSPSSILRAQDEEEWKDNEFTNKELIRPRREDIYSQSDLSEKLTNIQSDLATIKSYGPLFIYFMSYDKTWAKLILMIMMYFFLFVLFVQYRKIKVKGNTNINPTNVSSKTDEIQAKICSINIPNPNAGNEKK